MSDMYGILPASFVLKSIKSSCEREADRFTYFSLYHSTLGILGYSDLDVSLKDVQKYLTHSQ